jgi:hypothetical protein
MEPASDVLQQHPRWVGVRSATPPLRLEPVSEKSPGGMSPVVIVVNLWGIVAAGCTFYDKGEEVLIAMCIVTLAVAVFVPRNLLFWKKKRSGDLRGIVEGLLGVCMVKWYGCRFGRGPGAKGTRRKAVLRALCLGRSLLSVGCFWKMSWMEVAGCDRMLDRAAGLAKEKRCGVDGIKTILSRLKPITQSY